MNNVCPECNHKNSLNSEFCEKCGTKLKEEVVLNTSIYKTIAGIVFFLGIIGGVIIGDALSVKDIFGKTEFNYGVMLYCWFGTFLIDVFIIGIYSICYRLDLLIKK